MKLNGNTSKRSAAARREAADFAAQERSAHRSGANRSAQSEAAARRAAAPKQAAPQRPPVPRFCSTVWGMPSPSSSRAMRAEVHSSSIESSGWACSSRRKSVTYPAY